MKNIQNSIANKLLFVAAMLVLMLSIYDLSAQSRRPPSGKRPSANRSATRKPSAGSNKNVGSNSNRAGNSGNRGNNVGSNNRKVNVDNSNRNVNVNIDNSKNIRVNNSRNTVVRHNHRPYGRPPHIYGGYRYRSYHVYFFHPYRPFIWGPMWHPWGFFITTLAVTAIIVTVDNIEPQFDLDVAMASPYGNGSSNYQSKAALHGPFFASYSGNGVDYYQTEEPMAAEEYYYDEGVYYLKGDGGYTVVSAPIGATIKSLPSGYETITLDDNTKNYYYGGAFYEKTTAGYTVVAPIAGSVVTNVSVGGEEVKLGEVTYVKLGETYFQPIQLNGKNVYEVVEVEEDK